MLKDQEPLNPNEEYVSYDVESLFTNIPVDETINYIINEIYQKKRSYHKYVVKQYSKDYYIN